MSKKLLALLLLCSFFAVNLQDASANRQQITKQIQKKVLEIEQKNPQKINAKFNHRRHKRGKRKKKNVRE